MTFCASPSSSLCSTCCHLLGHKHAADVALQLSILEMLLASKQASILMRGRDLSRLERLSPHCPLKSTIASCHFACAVVFLLTTFV